MKREFRHIFGISPDIIDHETVHTIHAHLHLALGDRGKSITAEDIRNRAEKIYDTAHRHLDRDYIVNETFKQIYDDVTYRHDIDEARRTHWSPDSTMYGPDNRFGLVQHNAIKVRQKRPVDMTFSMRY